MNRFSYSCLAPFFRSLRLLLAVIILTVVYLSAVDAQAETKSAHAETAVPLSDNRPSGMVLVPGGKFLMGCLDPIFKDAQPLHQVNVDQFWIDKTEVTNQDFAKFVRATGYKTVAERVPKAEDFPGAPAENLIAGCVVFVPPSHMVSKHNHLNWWRYVPGADWKHPAGASSNWEDTPNHPVVDVAWEDAVAYAHWAGKRLPTEAEFEYAARGGLKDKMFSWGDVLKPDGKWQANIWQGVFPYQNTAEDGFIGTAPVGSFAPNGYGLYDITGNVWEWCSDWYRADYYQSLAAGSGSGFAHNPIGPQASLDPTEPGVKKRVQRGGSYLCSDQYCARYLVGARGKGEPSSGSSNVGFRCVKSVSEE